MNFWEVPFAPEAQTPPKTRYRKYPLDLLRVGGQMVIPYQPRAALQTLQRIRNYVNAWHRRQEERFEVSFNNKGVVVRRVE